MSTGPTTFIVDDDRPLSAAFLMLVNAREYLEDFAQRRPERTDDNIQQALAHVQSAYALLDGDFYTEHEADPREAGER